MNISSENIVDVFLRKISESLPVGERDDYQNWQREHDNMIKMPAKFRLINKKLEKCMKIFFDEFLGLPLGSFHVENGEIYFGNNKLLEYPISGGYSIIVRNKDLIEKQANGVISDFVKNFNCCEEAFFEFLEGQPTFRFTLNFKGVDRIIAGPLVGKLKKAGFEVSYLREYKSMRIYFEGFDDVEKFNELFKGRGSCSLYKFFKDLENN